MYYKDYPKKYLGGSDIAGLTFQGCDENGVKLEWINFGFDGSYSCYLVDENAEIGSHYKLAAEFSYWLKVFDDEGLTLNIYGNTKVYRAGDFGCIIQVIK